MTARDRIRSAGTGRARWRPRGSRKARRSEDLSRRRGGRVRAGDRRDVRRHRDRRRTGGPVGRVPPGAPWHALRDPRRASPRRRRVAAALGFAAAVHAGAIRRLGGHAVPGSSDDFPTKDEMADYLESYATRFATARAHQRSRRAAGAPGRSLRRDRRRNAARGTPGGHRDVQLSGAARVPAFARDLSPRSCSSTRRTTAARHSCRTATCWSWAPGIRGPRSRWTC